MSKLPPPTLSALHAFLLFTFFLTVSSDFTSDVDLTWGGQRGQISDGGRLLQLSLDKASGAGFQSKHEYLYGKIDMQIKLVPGNSAGTVTAYYVSEPEILLPDAPYTCQRANISSEPFINPAPWSTDQLSSQGPTHDEIDFEFLGNETGQPYILHTNVFTQGKGNREQQFYLWFDPRADFHTYSILWNQQQIIFSVDGTPIRVFRNAQGVGIPYPKDQPMRLYSSLWNADDWATRGGLIKTDWTHAPFIASYRGFGADACVWSAGRSLCSATKAKWWAQSLDSNGAQKLKWVQKNYMIYNYCRDTKRFPQGPPKECSLSGI